MLLLESTSDIRKERKIPATAPTTAPMRRLRLDLRRRISSSTPMAPRKIPNKAAGSGSRRKGRKW
jgi:hypothetical protein